MTAARILTLIVILSIIAGCSTTMQEPPTPIIVIQAEPSPAVTYTPLPVLFTPTVSGAPPTPTNTPKATPPVVAATPTPTVTLPLTYTIDGLRMAAFYPDGIRVAGLIVEGDPNVKKPLDLFLVDLQSKYRVRIASPANKATPPVPNAVPQIISPRLSGDWVVWIDLLSGAYPLGDWVLNAKNMQTNEQRELDRGKFSDLKSALPFDPPLNPAIAIYGNTVIATEYAGTAEKPTMVMRLYNLADQTSRDLLEEPDTATYRIEISDFYEDLIIYRRIRYRPLENKHGYSTTGQIFALNLKTLQQTAITPEKAVVDYSGAAIWGRNVLYTSYEEPTATSKEPRTSIQLYDLISGKATELATGTTPFNSPSIGERYALWSESSQDKPTPLQAYDLVEKKMVTPVPDARAGERITRERTIVWQSVDGFNGYRY